MQPCQVCGATDVDARGNCEQGQLYRGPDSYSVSPPAGGPLHAPQSDAGAFYYSTTSEAGRQPSAPPYPVSTSGPPDGAHPSAAQQFVHRFQAVQ